MHSNHKRATHLRMSKPSDSRPTHVDKDDSCGNWNDVYTAIKDSIKQAKDEKDEVEPDLTEAEYEIISMSRSEGRPEKWLMSEEDTIYENVSNNSATYTHTCTYDQNVSVSFQTTSNHSVSVGLGLGGGGGGANATGSVGYGYNRSTAHGNSKDQGESKQSSVQFEVKSKQAVVVKELAYR